MSFEDYRYSLIGDFEDDCKETGMIKKDLTDEQIGLIEERFEEHRECYKHKSEFDSEDAEIMSSVVYGNDKNVAIECFQCNSVIIDSEAIKGDE